MGKDFSLAVEETIEVFCRRLAQTLRAITGHKVEITNEEFQAMAQRVQAKPAQRAKQPTHPRRTK